ncbi:MAG: hypothetical protein VW547_03320 [Alphaproteobacteria bacterium]
MKAGQLASVGKSFEEIKGSRPLQLSLTIGKIVKEAEEAHALMVEKIRPFIDDQGRVTDEDQATAILNEDVTISVPPLLIGELTATDLTVDKDFALLFLVTTGIVTEA